jgi:choice-of-anchor B domain-containing protein
MGSFHGLSAIRILTSGIGAPARGTMTLIVVVVLLALPAQSVSRTNCIDGEAGEFTCHNVDLLSHMPLSEMGGEGSGADNWGWQDPETGRYYAIMTKSNMTAFVDVTDPVNPMYLGRMLSTAGEDFSRDAKTYANHLFVVADIEDHGMQVFDLTRLRDVVAPQTFEPDFLYTEKGASHNMAINEETGYAYLVAGDDDAGCERGLHVVDIRTPLSPQMAGCWADINRSHDTQCVTYRGPDVDHFGSEVCFVSNAPELLVVDVSDKSDIRLIGRSSYPDARFTHQGWLSEDHRFFVINDERDEQVLGINTRTIVMDVSDLDSPEYVGSHLAETAVTDHNLYIKGEYMYQANYSVGMRILHIDDLANAQLTEVAWFDTFPATDGLADLGAWNVYPFFDNGTLLVSDFTTGLFMLRANLGGFGINPGLNDSWWNPATPGQGFFLTVYEEIGMVFLAWFTYDTERPDESVEAILGEPGHRWLTAFGPYSGHQAALDIELTRGGVFDAAAPMPTQDPDGTIILEFTDCNTGLLTYDIHSIGHQGEIPIERIALDNVSLCESLAAPL